MKIDKQKFLAGIMVIAALIMAGCCYPDGTCEEDLIEAPPAIYPFEIINDTTLRINGSIGSHSMSRLEEAMRQNPNTQLLIFGAVGSVDSEEENLQLGLRFLELGLNTHIEDHGQIEGGAVSLYLAGTERTLGDSLLIGVHSWFDGTNEAYLLPPTHPDHEVFIDYYQTLGFTEEWAREFYFFSINASPSRYTYWLSLEEIAAYQLNTH